jgi:putative ABC transport system substrate-binding protein
VQKRVEILLELLPGAASLAMLVNPNSPDLVPEVRAARDVAERRGIDLRTVNARTPGEIDAAFAGLAEKRPGALIIAADPFYLNRAEQLATNAAQLGVPTIYPFGEFPAVGGLISYGANRPTSYRHAGLYAARIAKGARPTDLPVVQPTLFDLAINLKTAGALGLTVPRSLLARADEVIE